MWVTANISTALCSGFAYKDLSQFLLFLLNTRRRITSNNAWNHHLASDKQCKEIWSKHWRLPWNKLDWILFIQKEEVFYKKDHGEVKHWRHHGEVTASYGVFLLPFFECSPVNLHLHIKTWNFYKKHTFLQLFCEPLYKESTWNLSNI